MAEKKLEDLPPFYCNLGLDDESEAGPSAPTNNENLEVDVDDEPEAGPSAPDSNEKLEDDEFLPPPPYPSTPPADLSLPLLVYGPPSLVFEDIYDACVGYVKKNCCYGSKFINRMKLTEIVNRAVFQYTLLSFGEKRESKTRTTPYKGGSVDGPENGPVPHPWDMTASPPDTFMNASLEKKIPHTTTVHTCWTCDGIGKVRCSSCWGSGRTRCSSCSGRGRNSDGDRCTWCSGSGKKRCSRCSGTGRVTCSTCDGYGKVQKYKVLVVTWTTHPSNFVTNTDNLPNELILNAEGTTLFEKQDIALQPLSIAPDDAINAASVCLLETHQHSFPRELIIRQRHVLRGVPFTRVKYQWKEKEGEFYVYGKERQVYFEDYPQTCCCCTCC